MTKFTDKAFCEIYKLHTQEKETNFPQLPKMQNMDGKHLQRTEDKLLTKETQEKQGVLKILM